MPDGSYERVRAGEGEEIVDSQSLLINYYASV